MIKILVHCGTVRPKNMDALSPRKNSSINRPAGYKVKYKVAINPVFNFLFQRRNRKKANAKQKKAS